MTRSTQPRALPNPAMAVITLLGFPSLTMCAWALIGDPWAPHYDPDFLFQAPKWLTERNLEVGLLGIASLVGILAVMYRQIIGQRSHRVWIAPFLIFAVAGSALGGAGRVITAGVTGANIGGTFLLVVGLPAIAILTIIGLGVASWAASTSVAAAH